MNDIVEVTGWVNATPTLAFVQKGTGVTNITGEKLCESQVTLAVNRAQRYGEPRIPFFIALADEERAEYQLSQLIRSTNSKKVSMMVGTQRPCAASTLIVPQNSLDR